MKVAVIHRLDDFEAIADEWDAAVVGLFGAPHPFFSQFWFSNYYRSFFPKAPLFVVTASDSMDRLSGVLPMVLGRRRLAGIPLKEAKLIAGEHSHVNQILVSGETADVAERMMDRIREEGIDLVYLEDLPGVAADRERWGIYCRSRRLPLEIRQVRQSPYIPTTGDFEDYRRTLSKKFRELLNNRLNRINRAGGFEITTYGPTDDVDRVLDDMEEISNHSWQGQEGSGLFSTPPTDRFYRHLIPHAIKNDYGRVSILYFRGRPAAFEFHVVTESTEYCLKAEYSREFEQVSPGAVLDLELIKRAFDSDIETYDLLGYADPYKLKWTKQCRPYYRYYIFNRSAAGRAAHLLYFRVGNRLRKMEFLRRIAGKRQAS